MPSLNVQGYSVNYDDSATEGVDYLANMDYNTAKSLFDQAAEHGSSSYTFGGGGYKIVSSGGGSYTITKTY